MKKHKFLIPLTLLAAFGLAGCSISDWFSSSTTDSSTPATKPTSESTLVNDFSDDVIGAGVVVEVDETPEQPVVEVSGDFQLSSSDGTFSESDGIYTITSAGTYKAKGKLEDGQLLVTAGEEDEVVIELNGASITCSSDSPIKALSAGKVEISAKKETSNEILDTRAHESVEDANQGKGAIYAKCDLKLKGAGSLLVKGNYNNGIHTTKDLTIQKQTLYVLGYNNAIKGNDSVEIVSGTITAVAQTGNGIKSENTDVSSKDKQRGSISITGGSVLVDSVCDAIEAAYDLNINESNTDGLSTTVTLKTGKNSEYSSNYSTNYSSKGLKAENIIQVDAGTITIQATDDALHANYGTAFENGSSGIGNINVTGGSISVASGDDGIHADNTLDISGGEILITNAYEGLEATHVLIEGGYTRLHGTDDGANANKKISQSPSIVVSGGILDVQVSSGDTDGIDSNGTFTQSGGLVISRGSPNTASHMSTGLDCDGSASITGGTFIAFNGMEKTPSAGSGVLKAYYGSAQNGGGPGGGGPGGPGGPRATTGSNVSKFGSGTYTLSGGEFSKTFYNQFTYSTFIVYSSEMATGTAYTLKNGDTTVLSWTQSTTNQQIS